MNAFYFPTMCRHRHVTSDIALIVFICTPFLYFHGFDTDEKENISIPTDLSEEVFCSLVYFAQQQS